MAGIEQGNNCSTNQVAEKLLDERTNQNREEEEQYMQGQGADIFGERGRELGSLHTENFLELRLWQRTLCLLPSRCPRHATVQVQPPSFEASSGAFCHPKSTLCLWCAPSDAPWPRGRRTGHRSQSNASPPSKVQGIFALVLMRKKCKNACCWRSIFCVDSASTKICSSVPPPPTGGARVSPFLCKLQSKWWAWILWSCDCRLEPGRSSLLVRGLTTPEECLMTPSLRCARWEEQRQCCQSQCESEALCVAFFKFSSFSFYFLPGVAVWCGGPAHPHSQQLCWRGQ